MAKRLDAIQNWEFLGMQANYSASALAKSTGVSLRHLERFFLARFHCRPGVWLTDLRLRSACKYLDQRVPTKVVAINLKYKDPAHFCHQFKKRFNCSPQHFAELHQGEPGQAVQLEFVGFGQSKSEFNKSVSLKQNDQPPSS